jgi:AcrR family transcriptional regulator
MTSTSCVDLLIYHFETRDGLLREVLGQARQRQVEAFTELIRLRANEPYPVTLARAWSAISGPQGEPYLRMFSRLHDTAGEPLWPGFRRTATTDWLAPLEDGMRSLGRPELATVVLAVIRGLLMDLDATGNTTRTHRAFDDFLTTIDSGLGLWALGSRPDRPRGRETQSRSYRMYIPEIARAITSCWISAVPSKMS